MTATANRTIRFVVQGIETISVSDGDRSFSARVWGSGPNEMAYVPAGKNWQEHSAIFGREITAMYEEGYGYVLFEE